MVGIFDRILSLYEIDFRADITALLVFLFLMLEAEDISLFICWRASHKLELAGKYNVMSDVPELSAVINCLMILRLSFIMYKYNGEKNLALKLMYVKMCYTMCYTMLHYMVSYLLFL